MPERGEWREIGQEDSHENQFEREVSEIVTRRRNESEALIREGKSVTELLRHFDNDYSQLDRLYQEKVGVELITDPFEASEHEIPISKTCSIVIPAYNNFERLEKCLYGIQASSFNAKYPQQLEVVVIDDGSPRQNIAERVSELGLEDLTVKVYRQSNGGPAKGRYSGALHASGEIVIMTDPDVVYSPTMIEEYMKRHEVLDGIACFGLRENINSQDPRLQRDNIAKGTLSEFPLDLAQDSRVAHDGLADSYWLKDSGHNAVLPIDIEDDRYQWNIPGIAWGLSVSAKREDIVKTWAAYEEGRSTYGAEDEDMVSRLVALGNYVIPNTGGMAFHQEHPRSTPNPESVAAVRANLNAPLKHQDPTHPAPTDTVLQFEATNRRQDPTEVLGRPEADNYTRGLTLLKMGLYEKALEQFNLEDHPDDPWFLHDKAAALLGVGGARNVTRAVHYLEQVTASELHSSSTFVTLARAYGQTGQYEQCLEAYERALELNPNDEEATIIQSEVDELHQRGYRHFQYAKLREAMRFYDAAIAKAGGPEQGPWSFFDKGVCLFYLSRFDEARDVLEHARALIPNNTWVDSRLGMVYEWMGYADEARALYHAALQKASDNSEAQEGLARLGE